MNKVYEKISLSYERMTMPENNQKTDQNTTDNLSIPSSRHNPKISRRDNAEVVSDWVAKAAPIFRNLLPEETERFFRKFCKFLVAAIMRDVFVHYAP